jgi:hypothetical protein
MKYAAGGDDISHSNDLSLNAVSITGMGTSVWRCKVHGKGFSIKGSPSGFRV